MRRRLHALPALLGLALIFVSTFTVAQSYHTDALLKNAWGLAYSPGSYIWVSDEATGWSTLYDGMGNPQSLQVVIPSANGTGQGTPTGMVYNGSSEFKI